MEKYVCASDSLRPGQLDRLVSKIKDFNPQVCSLKDQGIIIPDGYTIMQSGKIKENDYMWDHVDKRWAVVSGYRQVLVDLEIAWGCIVARKIQPITARDGTEKEMPPVSSDVR